jgi:hypothetical protein
MKHELKTWPVAFWDAASGAKNFEVRINDRNYQVGDILILKEYDPDLKLFTGEKIQAQINYTFHFRGMPHMPDNLIGMAISIIN